MTKERLDRKPEAMLRKQFSDAEAFLDAALLPPGADAEELLQLGETELKLRFPVRHAAYLNALRESRGVIDETKRNRFREWLAVLNALDTYIPEYEKKITENRQDIRDHLQFEVFQELRNFLEGGQRKGYIKLPTGSGKTEIFQHFLKAIRVRTIIVVPTNVLTDQTNLRVGRSLEQEGTTLGILNSGSKEYGTDTIVTTYASFVRNIKNGRLNPNDFGCLILDEAHKAFGPAVQGALESCSDLLQIGFTATPDYSPTKMLRDFLGPEVYRMELAESIRAGILSGARTYAVRTQVKLDGVSVEAGEYNGRELEERINIPARNKLALRFYQEAFGGEKAVVFCAGIEHAAVIAKMFTEAGISAEAISGKTKKPELKAALSRFAGGETKILCNDSILVEGFDDVEVVACLNLKPTLSAVVAEQRGGRVLRLNSAQPDKVGYVIDFIDDDRFKQTDTRRYPITFREVLGATAVPRAIVSDSTGTETKRTEGVQRLLENDALEVVGTEEDFTEILAAREKVKALTELAPKDWVRFDELEKLLIAELTVQIGINDLRGTRWQLDVQQFVGDFLSRFEKFSAGEIRSLSGREGTLGKTKTTRQYVAPITVLHVVSQVRIAWLEHREKLREYWEQLKQQDALNAAIIKRKRGSGNNESKYDDDNPEEEWPDVASPEEVKDFKSRAEVIDEAMNQWKWRGEKSKILSLLNRIAESPEMKGKTKRREMSWKHGGWERVYSPEIVDAVIQNLLYPEPTT